MQANAHILFLAIMAASPIWGRTLGEAGERAEAERTGSARAAGESTSTARIRERPVWKHKFGLRWFEQISDGEWGAVFYENQINGHWAIRPSIELVKATENYFKYTYSSRTTEVGINRVGVALDCVYYVSARRQDGTGLYLLAGPGAHRIKMKDKQGTWDGSGTTYDQSSDKALALSVGLGYHATRYFGVEYKRSFSTLDTAFPGGGGKNWGRFTLNLRFPVPGLPKGSWPERRR